MTLVKAVDAPNLGVNLDTGNFHSQDPYADMARLAPYAINVQVKTEISREGKKEEEADLARVVSLLREDPLLGVCRPRIRGQRRILDVRRCPGTSRRCGA